MKPHNITEMETVNYITHCLYPLNMVWNADRMTVVPLLVTCNRNTKFRNTLESTALYNAGLRFGTYMKSQSYICLDLQQKIFIQANLFSENNFHGFSVVYRKSLTSPPYARHINLASYLLRRRNKQVLLNAV
jgi:hypothetical protein